MTYLVLVEPADEQRGDFARWCIAQDPEIQTASHRGFNVPADLFASLPEALLVGAYIDGHLYRHVVDQAAPADVVPVVDGAQPEAVPLTEIRLPVKPAPKRRTRKAASE